MNKMPTCTYCDEPEYSPGLFDPPLCQKHLQLRVIMHALRRQGQAVTVRAVKNYLELMSDPVAIQPAEVPALMEQMKNGGSADQTVP